MSVSSVFIVDRSPDELIAAVNDVRSRWTGGIDGGNTGPRNRIVSGRGEL